MTLFKKKNSAAAEQLAKEARDFEFTIADAQKRSEKRAWMVATGAASVSILLAIGYIVLLPLKEKVPYVVMADPFTGNSHIARMQDDFQNATITANEAINKSNVSRFVMARESYDWDLIGRRDWYTVNAMANASVATEYIDLFSENNPQNPDTLYGATKSLRIRIKTIILQGKDKNGQPNSATVRFDRLVVNKQQARIEAADSKIATIAFEYNNNLNMKEEYRVENPLGFRVLSYRVDPENSRVNASLMHLAPDMPNAIPTEKSTNLAPAETLSPISSATVAAPTSTNGVNK